LYETNLKFFYKKGKVNPELKYFDYFPDQKAQFEHENINNRKYFLDNSNDSLEEFIALNYKTKQQIKRNKSVN